MSNIKNSLLIVVLLFVSMASFSQEDDTQNNRLGISVQVYPAGVIPTINYQQFLSEKTSLVYRLGANITDRQDFSDQNDNEEGAGFGGSVGYFKHFASKKGEFVVGFNTDLWNLWIDWEDNINTPNPTSGTTYIFVVQPWLEAGYFYNLKNSKSQIGATVGFGREINVITSGDDVAQDFIGSISLQYKFAL